MKKLVVAAMAAMVGAGAAHAGFDSWTVESEEDPFSKGQRVTANISTSMRSGVIVICDTAERGLMVRAVPGFAYSDSMADFEPMLEFAFDGERLFGQLGETGAVGDNIAASQAMLTPSNAEMFVNAFAAAKKQIAINDGISDRPHLLAARGSTRAGEALQACMRKQGS